MSDDNDWLERQYWSDVVAVKPEQLIADRVANAHRCRSVNDKFLDQVYGTHPRQQLDVFVPDGANLAPVLVFIHGGYWQLGLKDEWAFLAGYWLAQGVAVVTVGYRLAPEVKIQDIDADIGSALAFIADNAAHFGLDASRIVLSGISAGAHLTAMRATATDSQKLIGAVLLSGLYDLQPLVSTTPGAALAMSLQNDTREISPLFGKPPDCPIMVAWGGEETEAFKSQSRQLASSWKSQGTDVNVAEVVGENHFTISNCLEPGSGDVARFISSHLLDE